MRDIFITILSAIAVFLGLLFRSANKKKNEAENQNEKLEAEISSLRNSIKKTQKNVRKTIKEQKHAEEKTAEFKTEHKEALSKHNELSPDIESAALDFYNLVQNSNHNHGSST